MKLAGIFLILNICSAVFAGPVLVDGALTRKPVGKNCEFLVDREEDLTVRQLIAYDDNGKISWEQSTEDELGFGFKEHVYWVKFYLENRDDEDIHLILQQKYPLIDYLDFYLIQNSRIVQEVKTGDMLPFGQRPLWHRTFVFPLSLAKGEGSICYLRYKTSSSMNINPVVWSPEAFYQHAQKESSMLWLYYGFIIVMIFYNLFIFFSLKDLSYLYYIVYITFTLISMMSLNGTSYQYLWPQSPRLAQFSVPISLGIINLFLPYFSNYSMNLKENFPGIYRIFMIFLKSLWVMNFTGLKKV